MNELPKGWSWVSIGETGEYINGFAFKPNHRESRGLPIVRIQNLTDESKALNTTQLDVPVDYKIDNGTMLVSWSATLDVFLWQRGPALVNQHIFKVVPEEKVVSKKLLFHWLKRSIQQLQKTEHLHGSTMMHINRGPFMAHRVPLPPLSEQTRIVAKLEELLSDLDAGVAELKVAQKKLAQYRQSLLKAAVDGNLTAEWRKNNPPIETGAELLERILKGRRACWEEKQLAKFKEQGKTPPKDWQKKYPEPVEPDTTDLPELPAGWIWATLSQISWLDRGRSKHRPRNAPHLYGGPYPFVQTGDIRHSDTFISKVESNYSEAGLSQSRLWPTGTMCITIAANIGKTAILSMNACFPDSVVGLLPVSNEVSIRYVEYFMRSIQQRLEDEAPATAQKNINLEILEKVAIAIPPVQEQLQIVATLENALASARDNKISIERSFKQAAAQRQNILRAAFAGQLVPQDPNDEPASVLLERIRTERATQVKPKTRGRKKVAA